INPAGKRAKPPPERPRLRAIHSTQAARATAIVQRELIGSIDRNRHMRYLTALWSDASKKRAIWLPKVRLHSLITLNGVERYGLRDYSHLVRILCSRDQ